jgi:hypothetical protein
MTVVDEEMNMMEPIRILREEHDNILVGLETLEACACKLRDNQPVPPATLEGRRPAVSRDDRARVLA